MKKKKKSSKRPTTRKKKAAAKRAPRQPVKARRGGKTAARKRATKKTAVKKTAGKKVLPGGKIARKKTAGKNTSRERERGRAVRTRDRAGSNFESPLAERGLGAEAGGQSGDTEGVSREEFADSESVEELLEEGQAFEAGVISGVENAPDADKGGVRTRQFPEDDVPQEYLDKD